MGQEHSIHLKLIQQPHWHYDEALAWMAQTRDRVLENAHEMSIAVCEHNPMVLTLGRHADEAHLQNLQFWQDKQALIRKTERGGGVTLHGPDQALVYPVINLNHYGLGVKAFVELIQHAMIQTLGSFDITGTTKPDKPGIYVDDFKIGFVGIHVQHGVSIHGCCLNVDNDTTLYRHFVPCNEAGMKVTSIAQIRPELNCDTIAVGRLLAEQMIHYLDILEKSQ